MATLTYGEEGAATPITTYSVFDGRDREIVRFGAETAVEGLTGEHRAVTRFGYDRLGNKTRETDEVGNNRYFRYDAASRLIEQVDGEGHAMSLEEEIGPGGRRTRFATRVCSVVFG